MQKKGEHTSLPKWESTVDSQDGRVAGRSGLVGRSARVLAGVSRGHGLDAEYAVLSRGRQNVNVRTIAADRLAVQRPRDLDRQVALEDGAHHGNRFAPVRWLLGDDERSDLRCDCNRTSYHLPQCASGIPTRRRTFSLAMRTLNTWDDHDEREERGSRERTKKGREEARVCPVSVSSVCFGSVCLPTCAGVRYRSRLIPPNSWWRRPRSRQRRCTSPRGSDWPNQWTAGCSFSW